MRGNVRIARVGCRSDPPAPQNAARTKSERNIPMTSLKKRVGKLIPYPLMKQARRAVHFGPRRCEVCGAHHRTRLDSGYGFPVLEELQVVGGLKRRRDLCPICHSGSRERLIWLYLERVWLPAQGGKGRRIAHFAPEKGLSERLKARFGSEYQSYDLAPSRYRHLNDVLPADLEKLQLADGSVDLLIANHVMEHVYDLRAALSEVRRVLAPTGLAIVQVPVALRLDEAREGGQAMTADERVLRFGQDDHVRLFTPAAYVRALQDAGLDVTCWSAFRDGDAGLATKWELDPFETLFLVRPGAATAARAA